MNSRNLSVFQMVGYQVKKNLIMSKEIQTGIGENTPITDSAEVKLKRGLENSSFLWNSLNYLKSIVGIKDEKELTAILDDFISKGDVLRGTDRKTGADFFALWRRYKKEEKPIRKALDSLSGSLTI
jgi:hypothetical protein